MNTHDRYARADAGAKKIRKTLQLCRQVELALSQTLNSLGESAFLDVSVEAVEPAPNASHLMVVLLLSKNAHASAKEVHEALERSSRMLRAEVASAITRKRAPELSFMLRASWEVAP